MTWEAPKPWKSALFCSALLAMLLLSAPACDDDHPIRHGLIASFVGSGTSAAPNLVRLVGGSVNDETLTVNIALGGPTTSTDIYAFSFELVLGSSDSLEYVTGSIEPGTMLSGAGCASVIAYADQNGSRVTVGVTKVGGCSGNGSTPTEATVGSLQFRVLVASSTTIAIEGTTGDPGSPVALDSGGADITSVTFDAGNATILGTN